MAAGLRVQSTETDKSPASALISTRKRRRRTEDSSLTAQFDAYLRANQLISARSSTGLFMLPYGRHVVRVRIDEGDAAANFYSPLAHVLPGPGSPSTRLAVLEVLGQFNFEYRGTVGVDLRDGEIRVEYSLHGDSRREPDVDPVVSPDAWERALNTVLASWDILDRTLVEVMYRGRAPLEALGQVSRDERDDAGSAPIDVQQAAERDEFVERE
jgi:hypothetical protein